MNRPTLDDPRHADWHRLFSAALDDRLTPAESEQLAGLLRDDAEARRLWFLYNDVECGLAEPRVSATIPIREARSTRLPIRRLAAAAACIAFGMFCGSVALAYFRPQPGKPIEILIETFEAGAAPGVTGMPEQVGAWGGDFSEVAAAQQGVAPAGGARMLHFLRGDSEGRPLEDSFGSDVFRLVDVRPWRKQIAAGDAVVQLTAHFNAASAEGAEPSACTMTIFALEAGPVESGALTADRGLSREATAYSQCSRLAMDADPASWQRGVNELRLPPGTDYLMIRIGVSAVPRGTKRPVAGFAGHFCDEVEVHLARRPEIKQP
jgi:hypothetical protein